MMITSAIRNGQFWTTSLKIIALVMILTIPVLLTDAYGSEDGNFKIRVISDDMVRACAGIEYGEEQCRRVNDYSTTFVFYNVPVGDSIYAEITDSYGDNFCATGENHKMHAPEILRPVIPCGSGRSDVDADIDDRPTQSSDIVIYGDNNDVRVDQRQQNIIDQIIGDLGEILE
jgi:hypothetical protein